MKLSQRIYACAEKLWPQYLCHPFVVQMADGTLPEDYKCPLCGAGAEYFREEA